MSEPTTEVTVAAKREWLRSNGYDVGTRGKLSAEHEQAYASQRPAGQVADPVLDRSETVVDA